MKITEALGELKTIGKRITKKQEAVMRYFARQANVLDPLAKELDGGSTAFISRERQAIGDLHDRLVQIRVGIQRANLDNSLEVGGRSRTIAEWLTWRREVSLMQQKHVLTITSTKKQTIAFYYGYRSVVWI